jgi:hypothetical protein
MSGSAGVPPARAPVRRESVSRQGRSGRRDACAPSTTASSSGMLYLGAQASRLPERRQARVCFRGEPLRQAGRLRSQYDGW